jgi:predicted  nucleic acid-binding Zn-ribbon protein
VNIFKMRLDQIDELDTQQRELIESLDLDAMSDPDTQIERMREVKRNMQNTLSQLENLIEAADEEYEDSEDEQEEGDEDDEDSGD